MPRISLAALGAAPSTLKDFPLPTATGSQESLGMSLPGGPCLLAGGQGGMKVPAGFRAGPLGAITSTLEFPVGTGRGCPLTLQKVAPRLGLLPPLSSPASAFYHLTGSSRGRFLNTAFHGRVPGLELPGPHQKFKLLSYS